MLNLLWAFVVVLVFMWILGFFAFHIGGALIHLLLVVAVITVLFRIITGQRLTS